MEKEKKGLFGRLLDFWTEKIGIGETDSIGFWHEKRTVENHFAEMGAVAALSQQETKRAFWEEAAETVASLYAKDHGMTAAEEEKLARFMDICEMDIRNTLGNGYFKMDGCLQAVKAKANVSSGYGYGYQITREYGYE